MRKLSRIFRSVKNPKSDQKPANLSSRSPSSSSLSASIPRKSEAKSDLAPKSSSWSVYLIISTNSPIKTYVGVTTCFSRRLKQHNGELKGGAKATRAGRPWICACHIQGFKDQSEASEFESKWKISSRKLPRKEKNEELAKQENDCSLLLLQHRQAALNKVKDSFDCSELEIVWHLNPS
ncbi:hypothetical protein UlMin_040193 [Ulmus minor]